MSEVGGTAELAAVPSAPVPPRIVIPQVVSPEPSPERTVAAPAAAVPTAESAASRVAEIVAPRVEEGSIAPPTVTQALAEATVPAAAPVSAPTSVLAADRPRPAAVIRPLRTEIVPTPAPAPPSTPPVRPRAHVRGSLDSVLPTGGDSAVQQSGLQTSLQDVGLRSQAPVVVMVAPVEMWFGDARIGVKAGTKTYAQFRKYADVLIDGLKDT